MRRLRLLVPITGALLVLLVASPVFACGGLIAPNGAVQLVRTTTLAAYHEGIEHYVTSFEFAGDGEFGSIVPLPGVPTKVIRGGDWTLQRLALETQPQPEGELLFAVDAAGAAEARVILETKIDALDVVVLEGGAISVGNWAREHGFLLPPDAPEVLEFYAKRSPIFMAVRYDGARAAHAARRPEVGQGHALAPERRRVAHLPTCRRARRRPHVRPRDRRERCRPARADRRGTGSGRDRHERVRTGAMGRACADRRVRAGRRA